MTTAVATPKAIQTHYKGRLFRSRLEARWAVFFDKMGVVWEYEREGFHLPSGANYLPDFYLPQAYTWVEIKPSMDHQERKRPCELCEELSTTTNQRCVLLSGQPRPGEYTTYVFPIHYAGPPPAWTLFCGNLLLMGCRRCDGLWLSDDEGTAISLMCSCDGERVRYPFLDARTQSAYDAAISERFGT